MCEHFNLENQTQKSNPFPYKIEVNVKKHETIIITLKSMTKQLIHLAKNHHCNPQVLLTSSRSSTPVQYACFSLFD